MKTWNIAAALMLLAAGCSSAEDNHAVNGAAGGAVATKPAVVMYKSPNCECCTGWAEHLRKSGFNVAVEKRDDMDQIKAKHGVTQPLASCHTAVVDGYVIEGHVPAADVERLLRERPDVVGLTAPGMPMKSPGMQPAGLPPAGYTVFAFDKSGNKTPYHRY